MGNGSSEVFRNPPNDSEAFGSRPKNSEAFRTARNDSEDLRQGHTLTVREVARLFEAAGAGRTERSITNWCRTHTSILTNEDISSRPRA